MMLKRFGVITFIALHCQNALAAAIVDHWPAIVEAFFNGREVIEDQQTFEVIAPTQAEDSALVPISVRFPANHGVVKWYLFVDANPIMLTLTTHMPDTEAPFALNTRIRLDANSQVRVVTEQNNGRLSVHSVAIKTPGGGCGGAVSQDEAHLRAEAGKMKLRQVEDKQAITLQIKHPMRTGFERTVHGYYAKAWYIQSIEWQQSTQATIIMQLGPGISANPYFMLEYPLDISTLSIQAKDNEGQQFLNSFAASRQ